MKAPKHRINIIISPRLANPSIGALNKSNKPTATMLSSPAFTPAHFSIHDSTIKPAIISNSIENAESILNWRFFFFTVFCCIFSTVII
ncbi:hypothetical protein JIY74_31465 [Vibrio harveyi]|nr:hypothetical protein [Vibrio harveyi]